MRDRDLLLFIFCLIIIAYFMLSSTPASGEGTPVPIGRAYPDGWIYLPLIR